MSYEFNTLGDLLSNPKIRPIAQDAIRRRNLKEEELWNMTLSQLKEEHFFSGEINNGIRRLYEAADSGDWYYPLYSEEECAENEARKGVSLVWFPSADPEADNRPFMLVVPGGGFVNVWNLTEGWPIAEQFNRYGYHAFILTYQVGEDTEDGLLTKNMEDFARALKLIREKKEHFHVQADRYITCGFSAGGYLICLWNTKMGYPAFALPKPQASFPVYPVVSMKDDGEDAEPGDDLWLFGCSHEEAMQKEFEIPEHVETFPPCAIFVTAGDELVDPENSKMLDRALKALQIPSKLEIGPEGGHGFADGSGMCMAGWTERAVKWFESLQK
ncbi:MAG: alpha/beta hydrolase [Clostridia bacterium]|nr:alpha/beta hydrolase [Clostridia bacterium]